MLSYTDEFLPVNLHPHMVLREIEATKEAIKYLTIPHVQKNG